MEKGECLSCSGTIPSEGYFWFAEHNFQDNFFFPGVKGCSRVWVGVFSWVARGRMRGMSLMCTRTGLDGILGRISSLKQWSGTGTGGPGQW